MVLRVEKSIILLTYGALWLQKISTFEFHPPVFKKLTQAGLNSLLLTRCQNSTQYFMILTQIFVFKTSNKAEFRNLDDSAVKSNF